MISLRMLSLLALVMLVSSVSAVTCDQWKLIGRAPWEPGFWWGPGGGFAELGDTLYMYGVAASDSPRNETWKSTDGVTWELINKSIEPEARARSSFTVFQNKMWIFSGLRTPPVKIYNDIWNSTDGDVWYRVNASVFSPARYGSEFEVFNNKLWIIGGSSLSELYNDTWSSDDGIMWTLVNSSVAWPARRRSEVLVVGDKMWLMNGDNTTGAIRVFNDTWYTYDGDVWYPGTRSPTYPKKVEPAVTYFDGKFWLSGGGETDWWARYKAKEIYSSLDGITWTLVNATPNYIEHADDKLVGFNGHLFLYTGRSSDPPMAQVVYTNFIYCCEETCPTTPTCTEQTTSEMATEASTSIQDIIIIGILLAAVAIVVVLVARMVGVTN